MARLMAFFACLALAFGLFWFATATPPPRPAGAPVTEFSATRAMADIAAMAPVPHPVGSAADARVRDHLVTRMTALGLSPRVLREESHRQETTGDEVYVAGADVENVIGVLPGRDRSAPALVLMAHRDSVPGSPGAADDITGVASVLEIVRAIEAAGAPRRDIIVAITDGEEPGLLGANAFFADDPLAAHAGFVLNLEARGGGGRAAMFETGADNGAAIDLLARTARRPASTSLSVFVYKLLPNDTDFTIAKAKGLAGFNYAFIGRQFDYHSPSSTVAALDQGSVQHMGDEVLGTAKALAFAPALPARAPDKVYADLFGLTVIAYPAWGGWIALAIAGGLILAGAWRAARAGELTVIDLVKGVGATVLLLVLAALALVATRHLTGAGFGFMAQRPLLARFVLFEAAMAASAVGALLLSAGMVAGGRTRRAGVWSGLLLAALVLGLALQATAPTIAFLIAWPLIAAGLVSALTGAGARGGLGWIPGAFIIVAATAWLGVFLHLLMHGLDVPAAPAAIVWLAALSLWPLAWPGTTTVARRLVPGLVVLAVGLGLALFLRVTSPWTPRHPDAAEPVYVVAPMNGRAWRADQLAPGAWSRAWLSAAGGRSTPLAIPGLGPPVTAVTAPAIPVSAPAITVTRAADGTVNLRAAPADGALSLRLDLDCDTVLTDAQVNGRPITLAAPGRWTHIRWEAAPEGFTASFKPVGPGRLTLRWAQYLQGWPTGAKPPPPMPPTTMAWDLAGSTVVVGAENLKI
jgi:hypothetical protein